MPRFEIGKSIQIKEGYDITLISTGSMLETTVKVSDNLKNKGFSCRVISMHTVKPLDEKAVSKAAKETKSIFSIEEHSIIGGLGSAVAEVLAESSEKIMFKRIGVPDKYSNVVGSQDYLKNIFSLSSGQITETILSCTRK